jgi:hypothetical protein
MREYQHDFERTSQHDYTCTAQTACMRAAAFVIALTDTREERTPDRRPERHFFRSACKDLLRTLEVPATQLQKLPNGC